MPHRGNMQGMISASGMRIRMGLAWFAGLTGLFVLPFILVIIDRLLPDASWASIAGVGSILLAIFLSMIFSNVRHVDWSASQNDITEKARPLAWFKTVLSSTSVTVRWSDVTHYSIGHFLLGGLVEAPTLRLRCANHIVMNIAFLTSRSRTECENMRRFCKERLEACAADAVSEPASFLQTTAGRGLVVACALALGSATIFSVSHAAYDSIPILAIGTIVLSRMIKIALS